MAGLTERRVRLPLHRPLGGLSHRDATLLWGPAGWGECSPLAGYPCDPMAARAAAVESALERWPEAVRAAVEVNGFVPAVGAAEVAEIVAEQLSTGVRALKVKVGSTTIGEDADRVAAVRDAAGPGIAIRIDANGAWSPDDALAALRRLAGYELEMAEQPVGSLDELARLRPLVRVPLAADECVRTIDDARRLAELGAADIVVLKVQPLGGLKAALRVAEAAGVPAVVSSLYESSVGLAAGVALAAALPELPYACGLGTATLLAADVVTDPLVPVDGRLAVRRISPDPALLTRYGPEN